MSVDGMQGLATCNRGMKLQLREQTIYTPETVLKVVLEVWPEGIELDPCTGPNSIVPATTKFTEADDGLEQHWHRRTYCNPPYDALQMWLAKAMYTVAVEHVEEIIVLCPVRTNRDWFRCAWKHCSSRAALNPVKFVGYKSGFPAPLCLLYWGSRVEEFDKAVLALGEPL